MDFGQWAVQGWTQLGELGLAFVLSVLIGVEREVRHKSAGLPILAIAPDGPGAAGA